MISWQAIAGRSVLMLAVQFVLAGGGIQAGERSANAPVAPKDGVIRLFNGKDLDGLDTFLQDTKHDDPRHVFTVENGMLHISGDGFGTLVTRQAFKNYHLVVEFKWGELTWHQRAKSARDSGCLIHCNGPDGARDGTWPHSIEAQIIEGGVGDILVVQGKDADGHPLPISLTAESTKDRDGEVVWHKGGKRQTFTAMKRVNWFGRDPDWEDVLGYRGKHDVESPHGEWTRMDVIADGGHLQILVNGVLVNEAFDIVPDAGRISLQTELAEIWFRRWELYPLDQPPKAFGK